MTIHPGLSSRFLSAAVVAALSLSSPAPQTRADRPVPRTDRNSQLAHAELLEKARKGRIDVYFEGDSITRRWGTSDERYRNYLQNWRPKFHGWNTADFR